MSTRDAALRAAVAARGDELIDLLGALVRERSEVGAEEGAQRIVHDRLSALGFAVERVGAAPPPGGGDGTWGYPPGSYPGRTCVAGRLAGRSGGRSLHLSGHIDVVPVEEPGRWERDPWGGEAAEGRVWGRGAGDMKGGVAAYLVAAAAYLDACGRPEGDIVFTSVIEEECTGNGMKAVLAAGYDADATLIGEPSGQELLHAGVGVVWARLTARSAGAHVAFAGGEASSARLLAALDSLRSLERRLGGPERRAASLAARDRDAVFFAAHEHPFRLNIGTLEGGLWPSSEPAFAQARVRFGFGRTISPARAQELIVEAVHAAQAGVEVAFEGFRAPAYCHELGDDLARVLGSAHELAVGAPAPPQVLPATTDARSVPGPCLCYGPLAGAIHGTDEWVDIASLRSVAEVIALAIAGWQSRP